MFSGGLVDLWIRDRGLLHLRIQESEGPIRFRPSSITGFAAGRRRLQPSFPFAFQGNAWIGEPLVQPAVVDAARHCDQHGPASTGRDARRPYLVAAWVLQPSWQKWCMPPFCAACSLWSVDDSPLWSVADALHGPARHRTLYQASLDGWLPAVKSQQGQSHGAPTQLHVLTQSGVQSVLAGSCVGRLGVR